MAHVILSDHKLSDIMIESFYAAIRDAEYHIASRRPDLIVGPLRGAEPIIESMRVVARLEGRNLPEVLYVETGCIDKILEGDERLDPTPLSEEQKVELVRQRIEPYATQNEGQLKLCLVDEVESGGSIVKNFDYLNGALRIYFPETDFYLDAVAIAGPQQKCGRFQQLRNMGRLTPFFVENLFTVDRTKYLTPLIRIGNDVEQQGEYKRDLKSILYAEIARLHKVA